MSIISLKNQQLFQPLAGIDSSLIGWWTLDDGRGLDYSGGQNNGTLVGQPQFIGGIVRDSNGINGALSGWSDANLITIPTIAVTTNFTISSWVYLTSYGSSTVAPIIFDTGSSTNRWYLVASFFLNSSRFGLAKRGIAAYPSTASIPLNMWAHVAAVKSGDTGTNIFYYLNGAAVGTVSNVTFTAPTGSGIIGNWGEYTTINNQFMRGSIDDVRLYNRALSPGEIHALYSSAFRQPLLEPATINIPTSYPYPLNIPMLGL